MTAIRAEINTEWKFSNGTYIFDKNHIQIDPKSKEGNDIEYNLWLQDQFVIDNQKQKELVEKIKNTKTFEEAIKLLEELRERKR
ncbi:MAG: hypothetical protein ACREAF_02185 [Nitrosopumilaceae archaeon]